MTTTTNAERLALDDRRISCLMALHDASKNHPERDALRAAMSALESALRAQPADAGAREKEIIERAISDPDAYLALVNAQLDQAGVPHRYRRFNKSEVEMTAARSRPALNDPVVDPRNSDEGDERSAPLVDLVSRFSGALLAKLKAAEAKYGYNNAWMRDGWDATCQEHMIEHLAKGDPLDVAAYCAFMWHHGWATAPATPPQPAVSGEVREAAKVALDLLDAEDARQSKLHDLLETIREQIRLDVEPDHRPAGLFQNIQDAVYAMRGRTLLMNDAAITSPLRLIADQSAALAEASTAVADLRQALEHIRDGYDRADISHVDYRVGAYKAALTALASQEQP